MRHLLPRRSARNATRVLTRRQFVLLGAAAAPVIALARPASAHAVIVEAKPKAGDTVTDRALAVRLRFNSRIDRKRSRLVLVGPDRKELTIPILDEGSPDIIMGQATLVLSGAYRMRWQVLAIDGHITRGDINFTVKIAAA